MPELPEVETLCRALHEALVGTTVTAFTFFRSDLRDPIPTEELQEVLVGQQIVSVSRRSKYLLIHTDLGIGIIHLGMTGNLLHSKTDHPHWSHTHAVLSYVDKKGHKGFLHYVDPRRFGRLSCLKQHNISEHPFFHSLGPEPLPLTSTELAQHLFELSRSRKAPIKNFIMDARIVVGVGNIYASESLFRAGISPRRPAGSVSLQKYLHLAAAIQATLKEAIHAGGTTLRDFKNSAGEPGYFSINLNVYGRSEEPCPKCAKKINMIRQAGRSTYFCSGCQK